jgi:hypothetical protein
MSIVQNRVFVVLNLPLPVPELIKAARAIIAALTGNAHLPDPNPSIATLAASVTALDTAETATQTRAHGTVAVRNAARSTLLADLRALKGYVQQQADANPEQGTTIILSAGMAVRKATSRAKAPFAVKSGAVSGSVLLEAKAAGRRAAYDWEWSADGGKTWTAAPSTLQAKTTIVGLPVGTTVQFRFRAIVKSGEGDWSQPLALVVR